MNLQKSSFYYQGHPRDDGPLRDALKALAFKYRRWGYETLTELLHRDGWRDNHKRIYRVYREEELQVRRRKRRKTKLWRGEPLVVPEGPTQVWGMDFVSDQLANGRRIRALVVLDLFSREILAIEVDTSLPGHRVIRALERVIIQRGTPEKIITDNGPEFRGKAMNRWAYARDITQLFIQPGKPMQNGFVEGFNSTLRD